MAEDDLHELDAAVLAERQLFQQFVGIPEHDRTHSCRSVHATLIVRDRVCHEQHAGVWRRNAAIRIDG